MSVSINTAHEHAIFLDETESRGGLASSGDNPFVSVAPREIFDLFGSKVIVIVFGHKKIEFSEYRGRLFECDEQIEELAITGWMEDFLDVC